MEPTPPPAFVPAIKFEAQAQFKAEVLELILVALLVLLCTASALLCLRSCCYTNKALHGKP